MKKPSLRNGSSVWFLCVVNLLSLQSSLAADRNGSHKPRVIATTDGEIDDRSSMIRFLLYACDFDVAGIVQVNSRFQKHGHSDKMWIEAQLEAYEQVLPNLRKHRSDYPDAEKLRGVMRVGNETSSNAVMPFKDESCRMHCRRVAYYHISCGRRRNEQDERANGRDRRVYHRVRSRSCSSLG